MVDHTFCPRICFGYSAIIRLVSLQYLCGLSVIHSSIGLHFELPTLFHCALDGAWAYTTKDDFKTNRQKQINTAGRGPKTKLIARDLLELNRISNLCLRQSFIITLENSRRTDCCTKFIQDHKKKFEQKMNNTAIEQTEPV